MVKRNRWRSARLAVVLGGALFLASLPILPLRFTGLPGRAPDLSSVGKVRDLLCRRFGWHEPLSKASSNSRSSRDGRPATADNLLEQAARDLLVQISSCPQNPALPNRLGMVYVCMGELEKAEKHFQRAVELAHLGLGNLEEKGQILRSQGRVKEASSLILESSRLNVELCAAHGNLARVYERLGQHDKVMAELDKLNQDGPILAGAPTKISLDKHPVSQAVARLLAKGDSFMGSGRFQEAIETFRSVVAVDPQVAMAHHQLGLAAALTNAPDLAVQELEEAVRLDPGSAAAHNNLGLAYQTMGELEKAQKDFEKAMALDPRLSDAAVNLGNLLSSQGRYDQARHAFAQAVLGNPRSAIAHNNLGTVLSLKGDNRQAVSEFRQAITLSPNMASAHYGLGLALMQSKNYMPAIAEFKRALVLDPSLHSAHDKIAQAHRKAGMATGSAYGFN